MQDRSELTTALLRRCTFPSAGSAVTCAVSGGADSLALLVLASSNGCRVTAIHVDHRLRNDSGSEADVVRDAAERYGAAFVAKTVDVGSGGNLEARARAARRSVLPLDALTGHTADDQAETVLLNLMRGAGLQGLAGMREECHPLLQIYRRETHELCRQEGLNPVRDPSNDDRTLLRNRVRHELIPMLEKIAGRDVSSLIARQTAYLRADADLLEQMSGAIDVTDARVLGQAAGPLARLAVRRWLRQFVDDESHPPSAATVERVLAVARGDVRSCQIEGGGSVLRTANRLRFEPPR